MMNKRTETLNKESERIYSLDILRIIAMFMIVCLHINGHGGVINIVNENVTFNTVAVFLLEALCIGSVNIYVLISGYFLVNHSFKLSRVVKLLIETLFYSCSIYCGAIIYGSTELTFSGICETVFPISFELYWFITAYVGMYLLSPLINIGIKNFSKRQHLCAIWILTIIIVLWSSTIPQIAPFNANNGYSVVWFVILYLIAAYMKKYVTFSFDKQSCIKYLCIYVVSCVVLTGFAVLMYYVSVRILNLSGIYISQYYKYTSPFVLVASISLFIAFMKIRIKNGFFLKFINKIAPLTMGVYLIHDNPNMRYIIWEHLLNVSEWNNDQTLLLKVIIGALIVFICCILIDTVRTGVFWIFENRDWFKRVMEKVDKMPYYIYNTMNKNARIH